MRRYRTVQGDTWDMIAFRNYPLTGGERNMSRLIEANSEYADYVAFPAGLMLNVPEEIITEAVTLPPWRR